MKLSHKIHGLKQTVVIKATAQSIEIIDSVPSRFVNCSQLFLSHNLIKTLGKIDQFHLLSRLLLEYNKIEHVEDLLPLGKLPNLVDLRLEGNPVCKLIFWDVHTINICPNLKLLNGKPIKQSDSADFLIFETRIIDSMYHTKIAHTILSKMKTKSSMSTKDKLKIIQPQYFNLDFKTFSSKLRSQAHFKDRNSYLKFLRNKCLKMQSALGQVLPPTSHLSQSYHNELENMNNLLTNSDFLEKSQLLTGLGFHAIGYNNDNELTQLLTNKINTKSQNSAKNSDKTDVVETFQNSLKYAQSTTALLDLLNQKGKSDQTKPKSESNNKITNSPKQEPNNSSKKESKNNSSPKTEQKSDSKTEHKHQRRQQTIERPKSNYYTPSLSIDSNVIGIVHKGYDPILRTISNDEFEIPEEVQNEEPPEEPVVVDLKEFEKNLYTESSSEKIVNAFDAQLKQAMNEDHSEVPKYCRDDSESSFERLNKSPFHNTTPLPLINIPMLEPVGPEFLDTPITSSRRRKITHHDSGQIKRTNALSNIAKTPNSFLMMKYFRYWNKRFSKRVNRRLRRKELSITSSELSSKSDTLPYNTTQEESSIRESSRFSNSNSNIV